MNWQMDGSVQMMNVLGNGETHSLFLSPINLLCRPLIPLFLSVYDF